MVDMINLITRKNDSNSPNGLLTIEWMLHDELPSNLEARDKVKAWIYAEYRSLFPSRFARLYS
tara:strand:- start:2688 stop:2876 length:189 start_codon:yes stop_codon:yes gene_type:complete